MAKNEGFTTNIYSLFGWAQLFVASLFCIHFYSCSSDQLSNDELPEGIKDTWVAVFPFENKTGTSELDALGEMVADWVMQGLIETNEGKLISSSRVKSIISQAKDLDIDPNDFISREQNVHYLIEGSYYRVDSTLMFASNIKNIYTGEVVFAFPVLEGSEQDVMSLIEGLKQRILG